MYKKLFLSVFLLLSLTSCGLPAEEMEQGILLGDPKAPVELVVYLDYRCPECQRFHDELLTTLEKGAVTDSHLKIRLRDFPIIAGSNLSHNAAWCARALGTKEYRAFIAALYSNVEAQRIFQLKEMGKALGFPDDFATCVETERYANVVSSLKNKGRADNVTRTPTLLLGDRRFNGASNLYDVLAVVNDAVAASKRP